MACHRSSQPRSWYVFDASYRRTPAWKVRASDNLPSHYAPTYHVTYRKLGMPVRLREAGIPRENIDRIAHDAMGDFYLHQNARKVKHQSELVELLNKMW